jgi:hypothetical protein
VVVRSALNVMAHQEDGLTAAQHGRHEAPVKECKRGGHGKLHHNRELLRDLHTRRGGHRSESLTTRWMGENTTRWSSPLAEENGQVMRCNDIRSGTYIGVQLKVVRIGHDWLVGYSCWHARVRHRHGGQWVHEEQQIVDGIGQEACVGGHTG